MGGIKSILQRLTALYPAYQNNSEGILGRPYVEGFFVLSVIVDFVSKFLKKMEN